MNVTIGIVIHIDGVADKGGMSTVLISVDGISVHIPVVDLGGARVVIATTGNIKTVCVDVKCTKTH